MSITEQQKRFVLEHLKLRCKNATEAAINAGYSKKSAASQASQLLKNPKVSEYLEECKKAITQDLQDEFIFDALEARKIMYEIMKSDIASDKDKIACCKDFLDRAGFKATEKSEVTGDMSLNITIDYGDEDEPDS